MEQDVRQIRVPITRADNAKQIVEGVVYAPNVMDTWVTFMLPGDVERVAHEFLRDYGKRTFVDVQHDEQPRTDVEVVESYIARDSNRYPDGAWVMAVRLPNDLWAAVKAGAINSFSLQVMARMVEASVEMDVQRYAYGVTSPDPVDGHTHLFAVEVDPTGKVISGATSTALGHSHRINGPSSTGQANDGHSHRYRVASVLYGTPETEIEKIPG